MSLRSDLLAVHLEPGEETGRVVGEDTGRACSLDSGHGVVGEQEAASRRQPHELLAGDGRDEAEVAAELDLPVEREVADEVRIDPVERASERRGERLRRAARGREEAELTHARIRSPAGSKKAPCATRAPTSRRSTRTSKRVPTSVRPGGSQASPITLPTASDRRALVTRPAG